MPETTHRIVYHISIRRKNKSLRKNEQELKVISNYKATINSKYNIVRLETHTRSRPPLQKLLSKNGHIYLGYIDSSCYILLSALRGFIDPACANLIRPSRKQVYIS
jgi:hypothetical protein